MIYTLSACKNQPVREIAKVEPIRVHVAEVQRGEISLPVRSIGIVATSEEIRLSFKTGGIIARTYVDEGQSVKSGQLLAELNLSEITAQVNQAENGYEKALRDFNRAKNLHADSVATLEQFQNAETGLNVAKSILDAARFNLVHSRIKAPGDGIILKQLARENELVAPGFPVYALGIKGKGWIVRTGLSDRDIVRIHAGDSAVVTIDAWPGQVFKAGVNRLDEAANPQTGTYEIELGLEKTPLKLAAGFIAKVEVYPSNKTACWMVPVESLVEADGDSGFIYTVEPNGLARKIRVTVATLVGTKVALTAGVDNISKVVSGGASYLSDGMPVEISK
jgi:RND family efflux transporter MFP subunit